jgi:CRP-like cAMP-binding protein
MNGLIDFIRQQSDISQETAAQIAAHAEFRTYSKNDYIFTPDAVCQQVYLMTKGLVRCFYLFDDKEINLRLLCENSAVIAYSSYLNQEKTQEFVQAIEPCEGFMFSKKALDSLAESTPAIHQLSLQTAERHYLSMERRLLTIQFKTAEERLRYFRENMEPGIVERTPAIHVASYLGMTPESLSRAKRHLNK